MIRVQVVDPRHMPALLSAYAVRAADHTRIRVSAALQYRDRVIAVRKLALAAGETNPPDIPQE